MIFTSDNAAEAAEKIEAQRTRAASTVVSAKCMSHGMGIVLCRVKKHGGVDHAYRKIDFRQGSARGSKERRTDLERELRAVDDSTAWLPFGETAQIK
jgi:hypothetical protein